MGQQRFGEAILLDAAADLRAVEQDVVVAQEDEACVPEDGVAVLRGVVFVPGLLLEEDGVFVLVGAELGAFGVGGGLDGGELSEAFPGPFACQELFQAVDGLGGVHS